MEIQDCWRIANGKCLDIPPEDAFGFIYLIKCTHPNYKNYEYVGRKVFLHSSKKRITKREIKQTGTRKRIIRSKVDSQWKNYWGSSKELLEVIKLIGKEYFTREILDFGKNKSDLSLKEVEWMIKYNVLRKKESWNNWASLRVYKKQLL